MPGKKMKPVLAWAIVYRNGQELRGKDTGVHVLFARRAYAKEQMDKTNDDYGPICRIARVQITELPHRKERT